MYFDYYAANGLPDIYEQKKSMFEESDKKDDVKTSHGSIRIQSLEINNFKGVKHGYIELYPVGKKQSSKEKSNILALYGQNGSGKTTVIQVIYLLKLIMEGHVPPDETARLISQCAENAQIKAVFEYRREGDYPVEYLTYSFTLIHMHYDDADETETVGICDEVLSLCKRDLSGKLIEKTHKLFDTTSKSKVLNTSVIEVDVRDVDKPDRIWKEKFQIEGDWLNFFPWTREGVIRRGASLLFAQELGDIDTGINFADSVCDEAYTIRPNRYSYIGLLTAFARNCLFVAGANLFNQFSYDKAPLYLRRGYYEIHQEDKFSFKSAIKLARSLVPLNGVLSAVIPGLKVGMKVNYSNEQWLEILDKVRQINPDALLDDDMVEQFCEVMGAIAEKKKLFSEHNDLIDSIVNGSVTFDEEDLEKEIKELSGDDKEPDPFEYDTSPKDFKVEFFTKRGETVTPLMDESEGIKHIIYDLDLFIAAYNDPGITVAIDEFDAGIFEYLLGEMLKIFEQHGKGQFIFTSHNLRPLEVLDRSFICFTTANPQKRYLRMKYINQTNNLRDVYYRQILVGEQDEDLYDLVNSFELKDALDRAGEE